MISFLAEIVYIACLFCGAIAVLIVAVAILCAVFADKEEIDYED